MLRSLLYVSQKTLSRHEEIEAIRHIDLVAQSRNADLGVTGALISAGPYFTQRLEGPAAAISELMESISRDPRHCDLRIVEDRMIENREFAGWTIAYSGPSSFLSRHIGALLDHREPRPSDIDALSRMILGLAK